MPIYTDVLKSWRNKQVYHKVAYVYIAYYRCNEIMKKKQRYPSVTYVYTPHYKCIETTEK